MLSVSAPDSAKMSCERDRPCTGLSLLEMKLITLHVENLFFTGCQGSMVKCDTEFTHCRCIVVVHVGHALELY